MNEAPEDVPNFAVHALADTVSLRVICRCRRVRDAEIVEKLSKRSFELSATIMATYFRPRVASEPAFLEFGGDVSCSFVVNSNKLRQAGHTVNTCECIEFIYLTSTSLNCPGPNEVDINLLPRDSADLSCRKMPITTSIRFVALGSVRRVVVNEFVQARVIKETHSFFQALFLRVAEDVMKPNNCLFNDVVGQNNLPRCFLGCIGWRVDSELNISKIA